MLHSALFMIFFVYVQGIQNNIDIGLMLTNGLSAQKLANHCDSSSNDDMKRAPLPMLAQCWHRVEQSRPTKPSKIEV